jgi:cytochrome d ubiquinol oxidase subunit I
MDAVMLSRLQFAFTIGFHFIFPPTTFALTLIILIVESAYVRKGEDRFREVSAFLTRILGLVFVLGTATGVVMEFSFGNNWSRYARVVGDIFGAPLAAEAILAFFLESVFLGVLVFGRNRVSRRAYRWAAFLVFLGAHLSGFWIIAANSWMQTPAGFRIARGGIAVLTDFPAAVFNPSTLIRYGHTILAGWITGSLVVVAIACWYMLKGAFAEQACILFRVGLSIFVAASLLQLGSGHIHSLQVARTQPEKMAAFEALWKTQRGAPLSLLALPDEKNESNRFFLGIPRMLSFMIHFDSDARVQGLDAFPRDQRPPVTVPFASYHAMFFLGFWFIVLSLAAILQTVRGKIGKSRLLLKALLFSSPLGYIACETGWIAAEVGRQPWVVYRVLKTSQAASPLVPAGQIAATLFLFLIVYGILFSVFLKVFLKFVRTGPLPTRTSGY